MPIIPHMYTQVQLQEGWKQSGVPSQVPHLATNSHYLCLSWEDFSEELSRLGQDTLAPDSAWRNANSFSQSQLLAPVSL